MKINQKIFGVNSFSNWIWLVFGSRKLLTTILLQASSKQKSLPEEDVLDATSIKTRPRLTSARKCFWSRILFDCLGKLQQLHTYIHMHIVGHFNTSMRITAQLLTSFMFCVLILHLSGGTYGLMSMPNNRFSVKLFHGNFIYSELLPQICSEVNTEEIFFFHILMLITTLQ